MRVTNNITYNTYVNDLMRKQDDFYQLHKQMSTQKRVNAPSDDPLKVNTLLTSKTVLSSIEQYEQGIDSGISYLSVAEDALSGFKDILGSILEYAVTAGGVQDAGSRSNLAIAVTNLRDHLLELANTSFDNKYIFSGFKTATAPFDAAGAYQGDANKQSIKISAANTVSIGVNGDEVFKGAAGGVDILQTVNSFITALQTNDTAGIQSALGTLESSFAQVSDAVSDIGGKVNRLTAAKNDYSHNKLELRSIISGMEDADITKVISELQLSQVALEAAMRSASKVFDTNIFDYL